MSRALCAALLLLLTGCPEGELPSLQLDDDDAAVDDDDASGDDDDSSDDDDVAPDDDDVVPDDDDVGPDDDDIAPDDDDIAPDDDDIAPDDDDIAPDDDDIAPDDDDIAPDDDDIAPDDDDIAPDDDDATPDPCSEDADGDGVTVCGPDGVAGNSDDDCDDSAPAVHPGAPEICANGIDDDCDAMTVCVNAEGDSNSVAGLPATSASSVEAYFDYDGSSSNSGAELSDAIVVYVYADPTDETFNLVLHIDAANDGSGGEAYVEGLGLQGTSFLVEDDPFDIDPNWDLDPGTGEAWVYWSWADCCTDGAVLGPLVTDYCVELNFNWTDGISDVYTWDGTSHTWLGGPGEVELCAEL